MEACEALLRKSGEQGWFFRPLFRSEEGAPHSRGRICPRLGETLQKAAQYPRHSVWFAIRQVSVPGFLPPISQPCPSRCEGRPAPSPTIFRSGWDSPYPQLWRRLLPRLYPPPFGGRLGDQGGPGLHTARLSCLGGEVDDSPTEFLSMGEHGEHVVTVQPARDRDQARASQWRPVRPLPPRTVPAPAPGPSASVPEHLILTTPASAIAGTRHCFARSRILRGGEC